MSVDVSSENHAFFREMWNTLDRSGVSATTVTTVNNSNIVYDSATDAFTISYNGTVPSAIFFNMNPSIIFFMNFTLNWKLYNTINILHLTWGDNTSRFQIELKVNSTASVSTFSSTNVRLLYKASDGKIYQIYTTTANCIYNEKDHFCSISYNDVGDIEFMIDGVRIFNINEQTYPIIDRLDVSYYGNFAISYDNGWAYITTNQVTTTALNNNTSLRTGALISGSVILKEIAIKNLNYMADDLVVDGKITAKTYEGLESQPIISGMSNLLYDAFTHQKVVITYNNYGIERQYPPVRTFNASEYTITGQSYGNGKYIVTSSHTQQNTQPYLVLDGNLTTHYTPSPEISFATTGIFNGIKTCVPMLDNTLKTYDGIEVTLQLPISILVTKFVVHSATLGIHTHSLLGSTDGILWTELYTASALSLAINTSHTITLTNPSKPFMYYKYILQRVLTSASTQQGQITEFYLLGKEFTVDTFFSASNNNITCTNLNSSGNMNVKNGNGSQEFTRNQLTFEWNGAGYAHAIKTRHQSGFNNHDNAFDFYVWQTSQQSGQIGNKHVMSVTSAGVGIGKTNPSYNLDVNGTLFASTYCNLSAQDYSIALSNSAFWASNQMSLVQSAAASSNNIYPTVVGVSNISVAASNKAWGDSNVLFPWLAWTSNSIVYSSNNSIFSSNVAVSASNKAWGDSNVLFPWLAWTSNSIVYSSNNSIFSSNVGVAASNKAWGDSNAFFPILLATSNNAYNKTSTQWVTSGNNIYYTTGNVGIGTTNISYPLHVNGQAFANNIVSYTANQGTGALKLSCGGATAGDQWWIGFNHSGQTADTTDRARIGVNILSGGAGRLWFSTGLPNAQVERMRIDETGNVGIGTTSPSQKLHVNGNLLAQGKIYCSDSTSVSGSRPAQGFYVWTDYLFGMELQQENGTWNTALVTRANDGGFTFKKSDGTQLMYINNSGNVGVRTTTATSILNIGCLTTTLQNNSPDNNGDHGIRLTSPKTGSSTYAMAIGVDYTTGYGYINGAGNSAYQPILLNSRGGSVGIATSSPNYTLDVNGTCACGDIKIGGADRIKGIFLKNISLSGEWNTIQNSSCRTIVYTLYHSAISGFPTIFNTDLYSVNVSITNNYFVCTSVAVTKASTYVDIQFTTQVTNLFYTNASGQIFANYPLTADVVLTVLV